MVNRKYLQIHWRPQFLLPLHLQQEEDDVVKPCMPGTTENWPGKVVRADQQSSLMVGASNYLSQIGLIDFKSTQQKIKFWRLKNWEFWSKFLSNRETKVRSQMSIRDNTLVFSIDIYNIYRIEIYHAGL